jgi:hypothetical protein
VPPEPVLRDVKTIKNGDALIDCEKKVLERDEQGNSLTRWDGETKKKHPVTGKEVPDQEARVEVYRYVKPRPEKWPKADFIVGNPPFIGKGKRAVEYLGRPYLTALKSASKVKLSADYVMHWWDRAANLARSKQLRRFGFITSATITQQFNTKVVRPHIEAAKGGLSIPYAIADHPWVDEKGSAAVRIAMTVGTAGKADGRLLQIVDESDAPDSIQFSEQSGPISATLNISNDVKSAKPLKANDGICSPGIKTFGAGFIVDSALAQRWISKLVPSELVVLRPYFGGKDVTDRWKGKYVIDVDHLEESDLRRDFPTFYSHIFNHVKPERDENNEDSRRLQWWKFGRRNTELRGALAGCERFVVTTERAKHRFFIFLEPPQFPEGGLVVVANSDALCLGILSSKIHLVWMQRAKGALETRPRYNKQRCFDPFPFPSDVPEPVKARIRTEAEALDGLRKQVLAAHDDLTLTGLYNVLEALKAGRALTDKERDIHDRGLVTLIRQHHDAIDSVVAEAYGWPANLSDEDILTRLVALNKTRAAEEAKGVIRWLRPEFQAPGAAAPQVNATLDLGDAPVAAPATIIPWPKTLAEQVSAVAAILAAAPAAQHPRDIARFIQGTNAKGVTPVLDALAAIGQARKLADGRYAA